MKELFDLPETTITKPIRLIEMFGGIGSQAMALRDIGADFETYRLIEFDKYAVQSYNAVHHTDFAPTDICNVHGKDLGIVDKNDYTYVCTYSYPCTSLSVAGKMEGMKEGSGTSSSLLWEVKRILSELKDDELPDIMIMENVTQVHSEKNNSEFDRWLQYLKSRGYYNHYEDLDAVDYGIPQHRDRCVCVSILSDEYVDFKFPKKIPLKYVMKDFLEDEVDECYYINSEKADALIQKLKDEHKLDDYE